MQKAHLYEAILSLNRGVDEAVRGLERLKRAKDPRFDSSCFDEELVVFEDHRARLNSYFCSALQRTEQNDSVRFEAQHREYEKNTLGQRCRSIATCAWWKIAGAPRESRPRCGSSRQRSNAIGNDSIRRRPAMFRERRGRRTNEKEEGRGHTDEKFTPAWEAVSRRPRKNRGLGRTRFRGRDDVREGSLYGQDGIVLDAADGTGCCPSSLRRIL